ncbi:MAG: hypothetical protein JSS81_14825 [Acidobacteria bacterium]|nr:hypothetical protein [Acidobacteriota bacterium]
MSDTNNEVCELYIPKSPEDFIEKMAASGKPWADFYNYPLAAMIACACAESGFGTSGIYKLTGCPFNLQKPSHWQYPKCQIKYLKTVNKEGEDPKPSPFCCANNLNDAARLWCEWINYFPNAGPRKKLEGYRADAKLFAANLHLVVFAEGKAANTKKFGDLITERNLLRFT